MVRGTVKASFAIHEVVVLTGFSKHMLDYLSREQIFCPTPHQDGSAGRGRRRAYSFSDVVLLKALRSICVANGRIRHLREALQALRDEIGPLSPERRLDKMLFVEGTELCLRSGAEAGKQLRTGQLTFGFVVDLGALVREIGDAVICDHAAGYVKLGASASAAAEAVRQHHWEPIRARRGQRG
jgi:DNA-binding transcriptional MerR regulator